MKSDGILLATVISVTKKHVFFYRVHVSANYLNQHSTINQSNLRLFEKIPLLTQTQEGCTIELKK